MYQKALLSIDFSECPHCQFFMVQREQVTGPVYHRELGAVSVESRVSLTIIFRFRFPAVYFVTSVYNI